MKRITRAFGALMIVTSVSAGLIATAPSAAAWTICVDSPGDPPIGPYCVPIP